MIPEHLSWSQISEVLQCGHRYELGRQYGAPQLPAAYLAGGTVVHAATHCLDVGWPDLDATAEDVARICQEQFSIAVTKDMEREPDTSLWRTGGRGGVEDLTWWYDEAPKMVDRWLQWRRESNLRIVTLPNGMPASECEMTIKYGSKPFKLAVDRVMYDPTTDAHGIIDIKTGAKEPIGPYQLALYRDAMLMVHGIQVRWGYFWLARTGKLSKPFDLDRVPYRITSDMVEKARKIIDQRLFVANPGMLCGTCDYKAFCQVMGGDPTLLEGYPKHADH